MFNKGIYILVAAAVFSSGILATLNRANAFSVAPNTLTGFYAGHEEITRQSLLYSQKILKDDVKIDTELFDLVNSDMTDLKLLLSIGLSGKDSSNPIIRGNYAMDHPEKDKYGWEIDLPKFFNVKVDNWHTDKNSQSLHALRKYLDNGMLESSYKSCVAVQKTITDLTMAAVYNWMEVLRTYKEKNLYHMGQYRRYTLFYLGSATHTLQDSFSPAHSGRNSDINSNNDIVDVCFYDPSKIYNGMKRGASHALASVEQAGYVISKLQKTLLRLLDEDHLRFEKGLTCKHSTLDVRDRIWIRAPYEFENTVANRWAERESEYWVDENAKWFTTFAPIKLCEGNIMARERGRFQCVKHEARLARAATTKYLVAIAKYLFNERERLRTKTPAALRAEVVNVLKTQVFEGSDASITRYGINETMPKGVLRCNDLSKDDRKMVLDDLIPEEASQPHDHLHANEASELFPIESL